MSFKSKEFQANGHRYLVQIDEELSFERFIWASKWSAIYGFTGAGSLFTDGIVDGNKLAHHIDEIKAIYLSGDSEKASRMLKACADRLEILSYTYSPSLYICSLFINRSDEDKEQYSLAWADQKINDWLTQGDLPGIPFAVWAKVWYVRNNN